MSFLLKKDDSLGQKTELSTSMNRDTTAATTTTIINNISSTSSLSNISAKNSANTSATEKDYNCNQNLEIVFKNIVVDSDNETISICSDTNDGDGNNGCSNIIMVTEKSKDNIKNDLPTSSLSSSSHDLTIFRISCTCVDCIKYREIIIQLFLEDLEYNTLWERLQLLIRKFYDIVPDDKSSSLDKKYKSFMTKSATKWISDGHMENKKNIQLSLGSNLPLSNEMTFILVFSMLYTRDPHQLFELLCVQLRCIAMAYSEGLKEILRSNGGDTVVQQPSYNPIDLLNFILDGYDKMCNAAKSLSPLLFELLRGHLQKFSLTWNLLNKRVYQRWVYLEVQELIPECILSLKELLDTEKYKSMVYRFIKFDEEMTLTTQMWRDVWSLIHDYHMDTEDKERRKRIASVHAILNSMKQTKFKVNDHDFEDPNHNILEWLTLNDRDTVWNFTVYFLRNNWIPCAEQRLSASIANSQCLKCNFALASHYVDCTCRTCLIAGGPCFTKLKENTKQMCCTKCSFFEKLDRDYLDYVTKIISNKSEEANKKVRLVYEPKSLSATGDTIDPGVEWLKNHSYHLSWAVFKHLPTRQPYNTANFNVKHFCSFQSTPCTQNECRVATHIIAGLYPLNFSKSLIKAYQPLIDHERKELMDIQNLYFTYLIQKLCDDNTKKINPVYAMDLLWNVDGSDYALLCDIVSAFAECYLTDLQIPIEDTIESCFLTDGHDIELNLYWLECIYMNMNSFNEQHPSLSLSSSSKDSEDDSDENSDQKDPKLNELIELRNQMDKLFLGRTAYKRRALLKEEGLITSAFTKIEVGGDNVIIKQAAVATLTVVNEEKEEIIDENHKGDHLAEALKLAVNQKLNLTLEAELRTLKKEHSVLKDMVRDLEQIKENEEKQMKTSGEKSGIAHQCCVEHSEFLDNHPNKMCHRGDGQCTCYYCTIFGHTECNHGRFNETRDRLRKRLHHQIHNKDTTKSANIKTLSKNGHGVFKKSPPTNEAKQLANAFSALKTGITTTTHPSSSNVPNNKLENSGTKRKLFTPVALQTQNILATNNANNGDVTVFADTVQHKDIASAAPPTTSSTAVTNAAASSIKSNVITQSDDKFSKKPAIPNVPARPSTLSTTSSSSSSSSSSSTSSTSSLSTATTTAAAAATASLNHHQHHPKNLNNNSNQTTTTTSATSANARVPVERERPLPDIQDILEFIEGISSKKDSQKKAAKKAKQKQKKQDVKKIEALEQMRDEFHEIFFKECDAKNELKVLKGAKKKDKKKITEAENNVKKYGKTRSKFETTILELIGELKRNNTEFKFSYLPTKEQQLMKQQQQQQVVASSTTAMPQSASLQNGGATKKSGKQSATNETSNKHIQINSNGERCEITMDQSKRVVTIRRINAPHADPEVTITAKGTSPDKDKLLYTFVKGQIVPASETDPNAFKTLNPNQLPVQYQQQLLQLRQQNNMKNMNQNSNNNVTASHSSMTNNHGSSMPIDTNATKNDKKSSKKVLNKQSSLDSMASSVGGGGGTAASGKNTATKVDNCGNSKSTITVAKDNNNKKNKSKNDKDVRKQSVDVISIVDSIDSSCSSNSKQTTAKNNKKSESAKVSKNKNQTQPPTIETVTKAMKNASIKEVTEEVVKKVEKRKIKAPKFEYADPQYKNNKFDVLDLDDDDIYISEEESIESEPPTPVKVMPAPAPAASVIISDSKSQTSSSNVNTAAATTTSKKSLAKQSKAATKSNNNETKPTIATNVGKKVPEPTKSGKTKSQAIDNHQTAGGKNVSSSNVIPAKIVEPELSKKQKKKLAQQQAKQEQQRSSAAAVGGKKGNFEKSVLKVENMAKSLQNSMQRLHLNDDTTIELVNDNHDVNGKHQVNSSVSIMDQLNRGVKVEGLMLPPGITLTRVDPNLVSSSVHAKKESIGRICHPMPPVAQQEPQQPHMIMSNPLNGAMHSSTSGAIGQDPNGFIMVDTLNIQQQKEAAEAAAKKNKRVRRKNKNKKSKDNLETGNGASATNGQQQSNIITLRNPLFQGGANDPFRQLKQSSRPQMPINIDQPAAIIKNENGMFTIRNPALHQALSNSISTTSNIKQYIADPSSFGIPMPPTHQQQPQHQQPYLHAQQPPPPPPSSHPPIHQNFQDNSLFYSDNAMNGISTTPKHNSVIGSEIKSVQQQKQQQHQHQMGWQQSNHNNQSQHNMVNGGDIFQMNHMNQQQSRSYSPYDAGQSSYGFSNYFGVPPPPPPSNNNAANVSVGASSTQSQNNFYSNGNSSGYNSYASSANGISSNDCNSLFFNNHHRCTDSPPLSSTNNYYDGVNQSYAGGNKKYDDMSFLHNLQPGQQLNSEVTIHNISESKFHRDHLQSPLTNGVEITRIPAPPIQSPQQQQTANFSSLGSLAVGSQRQQSGSAARNNSGEAIPEFSDSIFAPNQTVNLSELESEERDIESFKRFNYYFEPPKNKPKVNLNVKDIVLTKKQPNSDRSSPYFSETASINSTPTLDDLYQEMNALNLATTSTAADLRQHHQSNMIIGGGGGGGSGASMSGLEYLHSVLGSSDNAELTNGIIE